MTVPVPVTNTTIQAAGWGAIVASDVNGLLSRTTALEGVNAGTRLGAAESEIDALQSITAVVGARNTDSAPAGRTISTGGAIQWDTQQFRSGISAVEDYSGWTALVAGVYAVSWMTTLPSSWVSKLDISGSIVMTAQADGNTEEGCWVGYLPAAATIVVRAYGSGGPTLYAAGGFIHIYRVAQGG